MCAQLPPKTREYKYVGRVRSPRPFNPKIKKNWLARLRRAGNDGLHGNLLCRPLLLADGASARGPAPALLERRP